MTTQDFQHLLFLFSFLFMVMDGTINLKEIDLNKQVYSHIEMDEPIDYQTMTNRLIPGLQENAPMIIDEFFQVLKEASLTEEEHILLIETAYDMIHADQQVNPLEWSFLLMINNKLEISDAVFQRKFSYDPSDSETYFDNSEQFDDFFRSLDFSQLNPIE